MSALRKGIGGDLTGWQGLPETLGLDEALVDLAPVKSVLPAAPVVRSGQRMWMVAVERAAAPEHVELWLSHDRQRVLCVEVYEPRAWPAPELLQTLGTADALWRDRCCAPGARVSEHVFAQRGVVLVMAEPLEAPANRYVFHAQLFAAMPLTQFVDEIGPGLVGLPRPR